jgi:hypothetical protein
MGLQVSGKESIPEDEVTGGVEVEGTTTNIFRRNVDATETDDGAQELAHLFAG